MNFVLLYIHTNGYSPLYSSVGDIRLADSSGSLIFDAAISSLSEEMGALRKLADELRNYETVILVNSLHNEINFIRSCFEQYHIPFNKDQHIIRIYKGELKHYFPDYKNYYYFPAEDTAIHKSVAEFADRTHREKAKCDTAYIKKDGIFIWEDEDTGKWIFKPDYKSKARYILSEDNNINGLNLLNII